MKPRGVKRSSIAAFFSRTGLDIQKRDSPIRTKYPGNPGRKRCRLGVRMATSCASAVAKAISRPPGKYGRKAEIRIGTFIVLILTVHLKE